MKVFFAPLQGYTTATYRRAHHEMVGGIEAYYTPFIRIEKGEVRRKDMSDTSREINDGVPTVPQVIARNRDEFCRLCDMLQDGHWTRIDLNMGCPFPLQTAAGRGSALLAHPDIVRSILDEMKRRHEVRFSIKMRLGFADRQEAQRLLPMLNEAPLHSLTLHPRLGVEQYKGTADLDTFERFYNECRIPLLYNGDIIARSQADAIMQRFPLIEGVMIGRGLLSDPTMHLEMDESLRWTKMLQIHERLLHYATTTLQGEQQMLNHLHAFWYYAEPRLPRKQYKKITKSGSLRNYLSALEELQKILMEK